MNANKFVACAEKTAFITGFTGECGKEVLRELLEKKIFKKIILIGRRQVTYEDPLYANTEQRIVDFDNIENFKDAFHGCEYGFGCLAAYSGNLSKADYIKVDHDYVINSAKIAHEMGCKRISMVSAGDANKNSIVLYQKTKGLTELHLAEIPFDKVTITRPGLLLSDRNKTRMVEKISACILKPIIWAKPTLLSITTTKLAKAMIYSMCSDPIEQRVDIMPNAKMHEIADNLYDKMFTGQAGTSGQ